MSVYLNGENNRKSKKYKYLDFYTVIRCIVYFANLKDSEEDGK